MKLYIMRHGPAEDDSPTGQDADRVLSREGAERVKRVASALVEHDEAPREIITSPLARARETADLVADRVFGEGAERILSTRNELALATARIPGLISELLVAGRKRVMLVGHEPSLSYFVEQRLGIPIPAGMQKAMVVCVRIQGDERGEAWDIRPRFVLEPKSLAWLGL